MKCKVFMLKIWNTWPRLMTLHTSVTPDSAGSDLSVNGSQKKKRVTLGSAQPVWTRVGPRT